MYLRALLKFQKTHKLLNIGRVFSVNIYNLINFNSLFLQKKNFKNFSLF